MQGFGIQTKNIDELIDKIEKEIDYITKNMDRNVIVLNNKLTFCSNELARLKTEFNQLKDYAQSEYERLAAKILNLESQIDFLKAHINIITTATFDGDSTIYAAGIAPSSVYEQTSSTYPIFATRADKDISGRPIADTYYSKFDTVSSTSALYLDENKTKISQIQAITGIVHINSGDSHQLIIGF